MLKRIGLFLLTNIAIIAVISIVIFILENVFWITISGYSTNYLSIFIYALVVWFTWSFISLAISKWMAKRAYDLIMITQENIWDLDEKELVVWNTVSRLAEINHIKMPEVWIYKDTDPNAFATWPSKNNSLVAVSTWLLELMTRDEIEWVIWHEMAHILNWDMVTMTLLQWVLNTFVVFISRIAANIFDNVTDWKFGQLWYFLVNIILQILIWVLASLIAMKFSRYREFRADEGSAAFVWKEKMIAWLKALQKMQTLASWEDESLASFKISTKKRSWFMELFSSHPALEDRIRNLEEKF
jgi:heat shock protein HtpX